MAGQLEAEHDTRVSAPADSEKMPTPPPPLSNTGDHHHDIEKTDDPSRAPSPSSSPASESLQKRKITGLRWAVFVISTLTAIFVYSLDNTIVANLTPVIANELAGVDKLPWLSVGFMIGGMATILPFSKLYITYDTKWVYISSFIAFLAGSALCGAAPTMNAEIVGRVLAGAGGNGMYFGLQALMSMHTTDQERPAYLSYVGGVWGVGTVCGPAVGGSFSLWNWRWGFYINLLFGAILLPVYLFVIPSSNPLAGSDVTPWGKLRLIDWTGVVLFAGATVTVIMGINLGGVQFPWNSGSIIALFVVSGVLWCAFAIQQEKSLLTTEDKRVFPMRLLRQSMPVLLFVACASGSAVCYISTYYIPIYFQFTKGDSAIYTALRLLPFIIVLITMMPLSGYFLSRFGWYKPWFVAGSALALVTAALLAHIIERESPPWKFYIIELFLALGIGCYGQNAFAVSQAVVTPADGPHALALMLVAQLTGLTFGLSISGSVFVNTSISGLKAALPWIPVEELSDLVAGASNDVIGTLTSEQQTMALDIIVAAWQKTFICVYVAAATSFVASIFFKNVKANVNSGVAGGA